MTTDITRRTAHGAQEPLQEFLLRAVCLLPEFADLEGQPASVDAIRVKTALISRVEKAHATLSRLTQFRKEELWESWTENYNAEQLRDYEQHKQVAAEKLLRLEARRAEVNRWEAPTPHHRDLKELILQQLEQSIRDEQRHASQLTEPRALTRDEHIAKKQREAQEELKQAQEALRRAEFDTNKKQQFIQQLVESLQRQPEAVR